MGGLFDILEAHGRDMRALPLSIRKDWLQDAIEQRNFLQVIETVVEHGAATFAAAVDQDMEEIVAKRLDAPYTAGRCRTWLKIKNKGHGRQAALVWQG